MEDTDNDIIRAVLGGDSERFRVLVLRYQSGVAGYLYRLLPNAADRDDVCQDVFLKAYLNLKQFRYAAKFSTWLYTIAYRRALERLRGARHEQALKADWPAAPLNTRTAQQATQASR